MRLHLRRAWLAGFSWDLARDVLFFDAFLATTITVLSSAVGPVGDYLSDTLVHRGLLFWVVAGAMALLGLVSLARLADRRSSWVW